MLKKLFLIGAILFCRLFVFAQVDSIGLHYSDLLSEKYLSDHLHKLASDEFEGRETGEKGQHLTSKYIASFFDSIGIPPCNNGSFYQEYPLEIMYPSGVEINVGNHNFTFLKDFYYLPGFQDTVIQQDKIVYLGYGIDAKNYSNYSDGKDLKGKILIIRAGEPKNKEGKNLITGTDALSEWSTNWKKKITYAKSFRPAAILIIVNSIKQSISTIRHTLETPTIKSKTHPENIPYFYISKDVAEKIFKAGKIKFKKLEKKLQKDSVFHAVEFNSKVKLKIERNTNIIMASNVLGYIEGTELKHEVVVVSAHIDHLGKSGDKIYYGADDDGSGTTAIIEMARVFNQAKKEGHGPKRSILFIGFSGEEKGLLGSSHYVENPVFPLRNTVADLNIDMIGRVDLKHSTTENYIYLIGSEKMSSELFKINETINKQTTHFDLDYTFNEPGDPNRFFYRSDHYNFAKNNVPVLFYFNGTHPDYHRPTDTVDKINFPLLKNRAKLIFLSAWYLSNTTNLRLTGKSLPKKN